MNQYSAIPGGKLASTAAVVAPVPAPTSKIRSGRYRGSWLATSAKRRWMTRLEYRDQGTSRYSVSRRPAASSENKTALGSTSPRHAAPSVRPKSSIRRSSEYSSGSFSSARRHVSRKGAASSLGLTAHLPSPCRQARPPSTKSSRQRIPISRWRAIRRPEARSSEMSTSPPRPGLPQMSSIARTT